MCDIINKSRHLPAFLIIFYAWNFLSLCGCDFPFLRYKQNLCDRLNFSVLKRCQAMRPINRRDLVVLTFTPPVFLLYKNKTTKKFLGGWSLVAIERIACLIQYIQHTPTNGWISSDKSDAFNGLLIPTSATRQCIVIITYKH